MTMTREQVADAFEFGLGEIDNLAPVIKAAIAHLRQPSAAAVGQIPEHETLTAALAAMEYMGDILNNMDAVTDDDIAATAPAFEKVRAALGIKTSNACKDCGADFNSGQCNGTIFCDCPIATLPAPQTDAMTYTVDGERMSSLEYIDYLHTKLAVAPSAANAPPADSIPMCESCDDAATILPNGDTAPCKACEEFFTDAAQPAAQPAAPDSAAAPVAITQAHDVLHKVRAMIPDTDAAHKEIGEAMAGLRGIAAHQPPASDGDVPMPEPVGEIVLFGGDCKEVAWRKGKMPEPGTKLYASALAALATAGGEQDAIDAALQELIYAADGMMEWCVKNVKQWNFANYDWLHSATDKARAAITQEKAK